MCIIIKKADELEINIYIYIYTFYSIFGAIGTQNLNVILYSYLILKKMNERITDS